MNPSTSTATVYQNQSVGSDSSLNLVNQQDKLLKAAYVPLRGDLMITRTSNGLKAMLLPIGGNALQEVSIKDVDKLNKLPEEGLLQLLSNTGVKINHGEAELFGLIRGGGKKLDFASTVSALFLAIDFVDDQVDKMLDDVEEHSKKKSKSYKGRLIGYLKILATAITTASSKPLDVLQGMLEEIAEENIDIFRDKMMTRISIAELNKSIKDLKAIKRENIAEQKKVLKDLKKLYKGTMKQTYDELLNDVRSAASNYLDADDKRTLNTAINRLRITGNSLDQCSEKTTAVELYNEIYDWLNKRYLNLATLKQDVIDDLCADCMPLKKVEKFNNNIANQREKLTQQLKEDSQTMRDWTKYKNAWVTVVQAKKLIAKHEKTLKEEREKL